jgi:hypothetical protein
VVEGGTGLTEVAVVHVEVAELFIVSGGGVLADDGFELADTFAAREELERVAEQAEVGERLDAEIDERADGSEEDDDV